MTFLNWGVVTAPAGLPVTPEGFIEHGRLKGLTVQREPALIARELAAAVARAELYMRRSLITQTIRALFTPDGRDCACGRAILLPRGDVQGVETITSGGAVVDAAGYTVEWNTVLLESPLAAPATVVYVSGYGDDPEDVPALIVEGIYRYATVLYENRTGETDAKYQVDAGKTLPAGVIDCWRPYQIEVSG